METSEPKFVIGERVDLRFENESSALGQGQDCDNVTVINLRYANDIMHKGWVYQVDPPFVVLNPSPWLPPPDKWWVKENVLRKRPPEEPGTWENSVFQPNDELITDDQRALQEAEV